jgi:hypothetical protein
MLTWLHAVDFPDTRLELEALFRYARAHDVETGGHCDARAAIILWGHHWLCWFIQRRAEQPSCLQRLRARAIESIAPMTRTPMALKLTAATEPAASVGLVQDRVIPRTLVPQSPEAFGRLAFG